MHIVETLLSTAYEDTQLLIKNDELGDDFAVPRDVDFVVIAKEKTTAEAVASFVTDNRYGSPRVEEGGDAFRVVVSVHMPITQGVLCSVSALMACLAELFSLEYDGWGCVIQRRA
ncbi:ribonuclease E inhibitor RraB [Piscinibacter sp. XHJ-5]|uniref:ribonuclease E inhibitor RraB n=1 Tax=Piscinibacter sp. XHJ-5 TaxID=3037797 RepID=UPI0024529CCA|nr:ribonuclease E inhibitor RraB [Piscinibacter sp. XHJ-5]